MPATSTTTTVEDCPGEPAAADGWPELGCSVVPGWGWEATGEPVVAVDGWVSGRVSGRARKTDQAAQDRPIASTAARTRT